ncbi:CCN family member 1-like [Chrysoperla carnea]|uniref:CCN family member 1-like n=1 Tax=Chrysoperla carnea TaxID=189513 RepID=UPI001D09684D|nr:CCN family member 1-like [Chrysoperla carnea]
MAVTYIDIKDDNGGDIINHECEPKVTPWTTCTAQCGMGLSHRESNLNALCEQITETRICQERRCEDTNNITELTSNSLKHHLRKGHECKATNRHYTPIHFRFGPCTSRKHFRPKYCGECTTPGVCCRPQLSTTVRVDFICDTKNDEESIEKDPEFDVILENVQLGINLWSKSNITFKNDDIVKTTRTITVNIQWILKCVCNSYCGDSETVVVTEESTQKDTILHRVHRTAPP